MTALRNYKTADDALSSAQFQRPGIIVTVGPEAGRDRFIAEILYPANRSLHGPSSWLAYDLGFEPSHWAKAFGHLLHSIRGGSIVECVRIFTAPTMTLAEVRAIIERAALEVQE